MASGAIPAGGIKVQAPGGLQELAPGGVSYTNNKWRNLSGGVEADSFGPLVASGARVAQTRGVRNERKDAKTTGFTYAWTLPTVPGGSTTAVGSITGGTTRTSSFTPDVAGSYTFRCVITFTGSGKTKTINFVYVSA